MRMIKLSKITGARPAAEVDRHSDSDEDVPAAAPVIISAPVSVNVEAIRCFYPRRDDRPGTRITFTDGGGFAVAESYDEVAALTATH